MNKVDKNKIDTILTVITLLAIGYYSVPKLFALKVSVDGFKEFGDVIPMDTTTFMYLTGAIELITALILISSFFVVKYGLYLRVLGFFMVISTMIGALLVEFFARPKPEIPLVVMAIVLLTISGYELYKIRNRIGILS